MTHNPQAWSNLTECAFGLSVWNSLIWNTSQTGWEVGKELLPCGDAVYQYLPVLMSNRIYCIALSCEAYLQVQTSSTNSDRYYLQEQFMLFLLVPILIGWCCQTFLSESVLLLLLCDSCCGRSTGTLIRFTLLMYLTHSASSTILIHVFNMHENIRVLSVITCRTILEYLWIHF